jgi:3-hydroxyisobutyrate dehydrogenase-like beta-hydroxyacid dehydrogenase
MTINCVAIISPGDMGHAVGRVLRQNGLDVITCLEGRSSRTRELARQAGFRGVGNFADLVTEADLVLSIVVPSEALSVARVVADALRVTNRHLYFAECNAISPQSTATACATISQAGGRFIDASIIGYPPKDGVVPRFYVSGPDAGVLSALHDKGIEVRKIGDGIGQASGIKMCYAALTKGTFALQYALAIAAHRLGLFDELCAELAQSQAEAWRVMQKTLPQLPAKAQRWIAEMEQIAVTFSQVGVTPDIHLGAAEVYRLISQTPLARETPETIDHSRTFAECIDRISQSAIGVLDCRSR